MASQLFRRVLVVDDELNIVSAVRRELCTPPLGRYRYEVEGFSDPGQALERARHQAFDVVISDYRMPGMNGLDFLKALAGLQPDCARLVLSGQTDMAGLVKMVNETHIHRFIPKPWHDYFLKSSVAQAADFAGTLAESRRLAARVSELGIVVPPLVDDDADEVLVVGADAAAVDGLTRVLSNRNEADDLFAAIRFRIAHDAGGAPQEARIRTTAVASGREALKLAETKRFSCILADFSLPDMGGSELLEAFADRQPECARILMGSGVSQQDLIVAIDVAHIFGFVARPWHDYELKICVAQALAHRRLALGILMLAEMVKQAGAD
jgi:DNA-binding NtrC family response regulator